MPFLPRSRCEGVPGAAHSCQQLAVSISLVALVEEAWCLDLGSVCISVMTDDLKVLFTCLWAVPRFPSAMSVPGFVAENFGLVVFSPSRWRRRSSSLSVVGVIVAPHF